MKWVDVQKGGGGGTTNTYFYYPFRENFKTRKRKENKAGKGECGSGYFFAFWVLKTGSTLKSTSNV